MDDPTPVERSNSRSTTYCSLTIILAFVTVALIMSIIFQWIPGLFLCSFILVLVFTTCAFVCNTRQNREREGPGNILSQATPPTINIPLQGIRDWCHNVSRDVRRQERDPPVSISSSARPMSMPSSAPPIFIPSPVPPISRSSAPSEPSAPTDLPPSYETLIEAGTTQGERTIQPPGWRLASLLRK